MSTKKSKIYMWYKVQELSKNGLNKSQISRATGLDRSTVRKYIRMSEADFKKQYGSPDGLQLKLASYLPFVRKELEQFPDLSSAQIEDRLKEYFTDLPDFHSKTVYNFVQRVRQKHNIPKPVTKGTRVFEQLPPTAYGQEAQVDFGEAWLQTVDCRRKKVYFFVMVLSRSRYKFLYFIDRPFTTSFSVHAHKLAFEYFEGVPRDIIYDQDSVFIHNENLGDYMLTSEFQVFCKSEDFCVIFCRKADPQSKGKVENVVKYVKQNFLKGRKYIDTETLNQEGIKWLGRTGNAKVHSSTKKIPHAEWLLEKKFLLPLKSHLKKDTQKPAYNVRKDNTIAYKGNFYSLPAGTYRGKETRVLLEEKGGVLLLYSEINEQIATHNICINKGELVRNTDHSRAKSKTTEQNHKKVSEMLGSTPVSASYLELLRKDKPRYYRDNLQVIIEKMKDYPAEIIQQSLIFCINNKQFNSNILLDVMENKHTALKKEAEAEKAIKTISASTDTSATASECETYNRINTSVIGNYEKIFEICRN